MRNYCLAFEYVRHESKFVTLCNNNVNTEYLIFLFCGHLRHLAFYRVAF